VPTQKAFGMAYLMHSPNSAVPKLVTQSLDGFDRSVDLEWALNLQHAVSPFAVAHRVLGCIRVMGHGYESKSS
jgi:hypothetical protein